MFWYTNPKDILEEFVLFDLTNFVEFFTARTNVY
jgi:hypothetical protein